MTRPAAKALNKPLLIVGIDRKLAGLAFLLAVIVGANDGGSKIAAVVFFVALCALGRRMTRKDPNIFLVLNRVRTQRSLYDPAKREWLRLSIERTEG
jgi:type IV secretory pathway TrbD component